MKIELLTKPEIVVLNYLEKLLKLFVVVWDIDCLFKCNRF